MKIGLVDVDSHNFPNLPLMKISQYHKRAGDEVEFVQWEWDDNKVAPVSKHYDKVYMSKIFTESKEPVFEISCDTLVRGGSGYDLDNKLSDEIEHIYPDYSLYPQYKFALGMLTRGCPRCNHTFCITPHKDGTVSRKVADLTEFWRGQKEIVLLDQNILSCVHRDELLDQLARSGSSVEFNGGLDARYVNSKIIQELRRINVKDFHFAWDDPTEDLLDKFVQIQRSGLKNPKYIGVYVLTNFWSSIEEDLYRINTLLELGFSPFVMIYDKQKFVDSRGRWLPDVAYRYTEDELRHFKTVQHMQRWCGNRAILKKCRRFEDYDNYKNWVKKGMPVPKREDL